MGDLHLVHPALNLSIFDAGILIMVQKVRSGCSGFGLGIGGFGTKGLGTGLDNCVNNTFFLSCTGSQDSASVLKLCV